MITLKTKKGKEVQVPKYFTMVLWSDAYPYEVVEAISEQTVVVRAMSHERDPNFQPEFIEGGFAAHCVNQNEQTWLYKSNPNGETFRIRRKRKPRTVFRHNPETGKHENMEIYDWTRKGQRFVASEKPVYHYDYNF